MSLVRAELSTACSRKRGVDVRKCLTKSCDIVLALMPIGSGRDKVLPSYQLTEGLLTCGASGGQAWNPMASGRTFLELRPFYRTQNIENDDLDEKQSTNGLEFSAFWDNRDYPANPSRGNAISVRVARDWGLANSSTSWTS